MVACFVVGVMGVKSFIKDLKHLILKTFYLIANISALGLCHNTFCSFKLSTLYALVCVIVISMLYLFNMDERKLEDSMITITGILRENIFMPLHVTLVEQTGEYSFFVWLILITAFGTDIMAYFTGFAIGKHKLAPKISPKTIEGSIGGIVGSVLFLGHLDTLWNLDLWFISFNNRGSRRSCFSAWRPYSIGTLREKIGIKDYGNLIPGHGGMLDRFDSVLFTAPMVYYYTKPTCITVKSSCLIICLLFFDQRGPTSTLR